MKQTSFCTQVKDDLSLQNIKKKCCRLSLLFGLNYYDGSSEIDNVNELWQKLKHEFRNYDIPKDCESIFKCEECQRYFLRGIFFLFGSVSDIKTKSYQTELSIPNSCDTDIIENILGQYGLVPKITTRGERKVIYFRGNEEITDFLNVVGAYKVSDAFVNEKIKREFGSDANRVANCDFANIARTIACATEQINAINYLIESGLIDGISPTLKETAMLRLENQDVSLVELAAMHTPPITKSGVNHRLNRIMDYYKKAQKN